MSEKGILAYASILARRLNNLEKEWDKLEAKMDEKYNILSIDEVKCELEQTYLTFKEILKNARN